MTTKLALIPTIAFGFLLSCTTLHRNPASFAVKITALNEVTKTLAEIEKNAPQLNANNCAAQLGEYSANFENWIPRKEDSSRLREEGPALLRKFFEARLALRQQLERLPKACAQSMRAAFVNMRASEDIVGVMSYQDLQLNSEDIDFAKQPVPLLDPTPYRPAQQADPNQKFEFQKGDLMITKGVSIISATISSFPRESSLFSHIVFVAQNSKKQWGTIESYIGKGVDFYKMNEALLNENARILVLRPRDQSMAVKAHDYMIKRVEKSYAQKKKIPYDYIQDFTNNTRMSCEEVAYDAYKTATDGAFEIPWIESVLELKDQQLAQAAGLHNGNMMMPGDMELDPRFEVVLDWTDYRLIRDNWRKDAIMKEFVRWMNQEDYVLHNSLKAKAAKLIWKTREIKFLWPMFSKLAGIPKDFEKDVPSEGIAMMANLKTFGAAVLPEIAKADREHFEKTGQWMSRTELQQAANSFRIADQERFSLTGKSAFHNFYRPAQLRVPDSESEAP